MGALRVAVLALAVAGPLGAGPSPAQDVEAVLAEAQALRRQGRMEAALGALERIGGGLTEHQRGRLLLVRGNIAYERLDYGGAAAFYRESEQAFERARLTDEASGASGVAAARENIAMAQAEVDRRDGLGRRAGAVRASVFAVVAAALVLLGFAARRARPTAAA